MCTTAYYQVRFEYSTEAPHSASTIFIVICTDMPSHRPDKLGPGDCQALAENLLIGRTAGRSIEAFAPDGRRIGVSLDAHQIRNRGQFHAVEYAAVAVSACRT